HGGGLMMKLATLRAPGGRGGFLLPLSPLRPSPVRERGASGGRLPLFRGLRAPRQRMLVLLPLLPTLPDDPSPYATRCAFGLNPLFVDLSSLAELDELGEAALTDSQRRTLDEARASQRIRYDLVLPLKRAALRRA